MYFVYVTCKCFMKHKQNMDNPYITFNRLITNSFSFIKETFTWTIFHIFLYSMVKRDPIHRNWLVVYTHYRSYNAYVNKPQILRAAISCHQGETRFYPIVWYWKKMERAHGTTCKKAVWPAKTLISPCNAGPLWVFVLWCTYIVWLDRFFTWPDTIQINSCFAQANLNHRWSHMLSWNVLFAFVQWIIKMFELDSPKA